MKGLLLFTIQITQVHFQFGTMLANQESLSYDGARSISLMERRKFNKLLKKVGSCLDFVSSS